MLIAAAREGDLELCRTALLSNSNNIDEKDDNGSTALCEACHRGHVEVARLLLEHEASTMASNKRGMTPLALACIKVGDFDFRLRSRCSAYRVMAPSCACCWSTIHRWISSRCNVQ